MRRLPRLCWTLGIAAAALPAIAGARDFRAGKVEGLLNLTLSYGLLARVEDRDPDLIGIANGGKAPDVNTDDGDLNYNKGVASNMVRGTAELALRWRNFGSFVRAFGLYDFENGLYDRARTELSRGGRELIVWDVGLLDYFLSARFEPFGIPFQVRAGNQVINWGESRFLRFGVDVINPINLVALFQPASTGRDLFIPQGMVWAAANPTSLIAIEAFYQYDWQEIGLPPVGSLFSANDALGGDGMNFAMTGGGLFSDQGTDLDEAFDLPPGTLGFDPDFMKISSGGRDEPEDGGQYGFTVQAILPELNATKLAIHFANYHSRAAVFSAFTADQEAIDATSTQAVEARAAALAPIYESTGLSPEEAEEKALATAGTLTIGRYSNETTYLAEYPQNVKMLGLSFNTATIRTGTLISGEIAHHFDLPFQLFLGDLFAAAFSPIEFDPSFKNNPIGVFGADEEVKGFRRLGKTQLELGVTQILGPRLGASQSFASFDFGWVHVHDAPDDLRLSAPGVTAADSDRFPTDDSLGYRLVGSLNYSGVLGAFNVSPRVIWTHDFSGVTPGPLGAFIEGRKSATVGLAVQYTNTITADLSYANFFGAGRYNPTIDRDFVRFNLSYYY